MRRHPTWVVVTALVVLVALVAGGVATVVSALRGGGGDDRRGAAAEQFVAAWQRRSTGTWAVEGFTEREREDGTSGTLRTTYRAAQRPPDRLVEQYGAVEAVLDGRAIGCAAPPAGDGTTAGVGGAPEAGPLVCADRGPARDPAVEVAAELVRVQALVGGADPAYTVVDEGGGCFGLTVVKADPAPPLGDTARFCFDAATGALRSSELRSVGVVDRTVAETVRGTVTDADLTLPPHQTADA